MTPWRRRFWARWIVANAIGECVGLGVIAGCVVAVAQQMEGPPSGATGALLWALGAVALGAFEGAVVGWAQFHVLRSRLPALRGWVRATVIGAVVAWALGMVPSTVMRLMAVEPSAPPAEPALPVVLLAAAALGLVTGPVLAYFQWRRLRHVVAGGAMWWLPANAAAWALGMPLIFLGAQAHDGTASPLLAAFLAAGSLLAAGALVGAVHGRVLAARLPTSSPQRVLVSACLLGTPVRHDGGHKRSDDAVLQRWMREGRVIALCPEVAGGLSVPRPAAEIEGGAGGHAVLDGRARVLDRDGRDVSAAFVAGAQRALDAVREQGLRVAVLKEGSPSCGSREVHDGRFAGARVAGVGVTAALLEREGVAVFGEDRLAEADAWVRELEHRAD